MKKKNKAVKGNRIGNANGKGEGIIFKICIWETLSEKVVFEKRSEISKL